MNVSIEESLPAANIKNIAITNHFSGHHYVNCDPGRLIQVINNLLGNAIKFSPDDSEVSVRIEESKDVVTITIKDNGPGISREDLSHLFDRYWQSQKTAHRGTGLGLFISKTIIELHGGTIKVSSKLGQGAVFCVYLPKLRSGIIHEGSP